MARKLVPTVLVAALVLLLPASGAFAAPNKLPVVASFDVADNSASPIPVIPPFTATDADGTVTGYLITESSVKPSATAPGWSATAPTQYVTASTGTVTLYPWAKDNANGVSNATAGHVVIIPAPPVDADTVDGKHAAEFAPVAHAHDAASIVAGTIGVERLATYAGVRVVHKGPVDAVNTFATIGAAIASITDSSAANRYAVVVMPGVYTETLVVPDYVDLVGASRSASIIAHESTGCETPPAVQMGAGSSISELTVRNKYAAGAAVLLAGEGAAIHDATLELTGTDPMCAGRMTIGVLTTNSNRIEGVDVLVENWYPQQLLVMQVFSTANSRSVVRDVTVKQPLQLPLPYPPFETWAWAIDVHTAAPGVDVPLEISDVQAGGSISVSGTVRLQNVIANAIVGNDGETHVDSSVIKGDVTSVAGTVSLGASKILGSLVPQGGQIKTFGCYDGQYEAIANGLH